jgi:RNA polymerase sigma factor (sigma-70 family)
MNVPSAGWPGLSADSDEELLVQALNAPEGDLRAFEGLVLRYQKRVVANCRGITRDSNNAEDLAQEVLVKVFYGLRGFERKSSFGRWLQRIKINHCLNHLKKHSSHSFVDVGDPEADEFDELKVMVTAEQLAGTITTGGQSAPYWSRCQARSGFLWSFATWTNCHTKKYPGLWASVYPRRRCESNARVRSSDFDTRWCTQWA